MLRFELAVVLIVSCAFKCLAMSSDELDDFVNFLTSTSQLNPTLRKGADVDADDYDGDDPIAEHAWEESGKFEGDLILNDKQRRIIVEEVAEGLSRNGIRDSTKRWPNNEVIYYIQKEHFTRDQIQAIMDGIDDLARASCVTFRPYRKGDRDAVVIQGSRRGCFSQVGYQSGYQVLNLYGRHPVGRGCFRHGTVIHEMLHTLGFYHMQSSPDRDDYVKVLWQNIVKPARHNFRKYNSFSVTDFGVGYDYDSVLHYSRRAFSSNGQDTVVPIKSGAEIGQRVGLSDKDTEKLNRMYCDAGSNDGTKTQADEQTIEKTEVKEKTPKEMPFDGHGIGYHQGKAVVIKLLPAPETYRLPDVPTFHVFEYFSKAPQTLPTPENQAFHTGKEITHLLNPQHPQITDEYKDTVYYGNMELGSTKEDSKPPQISVKNSTHLNGRVDSETRDSREFNAHYSDSQRDLAVNLDPDSIDTFDRLTKIIKNHVYPSHGSNLDIYKVSEDNTNITSSLQNRHPDHFTVSPRTQLVQERKKTAIDYIKSFNILEPFVSEQDEPKRTQVESRGSKVTEVEAYVDSPYDEFPYRDNEEYGHGDSSLFDYASPRNDNDYYRKLYNAKAVDHINSRFDEPSEKKWYSDGYHSDSYVPDHQITKDLKNNFEGLARDTWEEPDAEKRRNRYYLDSAKSHEHTFLYPPVKLVKKWYEDRR